MKKVFMTLAAVLVGMTAANAQLVIGGGLGFSGKAPKITKDAEYGITEKTDGTFNLAIAPKIGYMLAEQKIELGVGLNFGYDQNMKYDVLFNADMKDGKAFKDMKESNFNFSINPYARFRVLNAKGFGIWFEGVVALGSKLNTETKYFAYKYNDDIVGRTEKEAEELNKKSDLKSSNFRGGLSIAPVLTYDINEHWRLETGLNFLSLYVNGVATTEEMYIDGDKEKGKYKETTNTCNYGFGVWGNNVMSVSALTIGAVYKF